MKSQEKKQEKSPFYYLARSAKIYWLQIACPDIDTPVDEAVRSMWQFVFDRIKSKNPHIGFSEIDFGYPAFKVDWGISSYERQALLHRINTDRWSLDQIAEGLETLPWPAMLVWETAGDDNLRSYLRNLGREIASCCPGFQFVERPERNMMILSSRIGDGGYPGWEGKET